MPFFGAGEIIAKTIREMDCFDCNAKRAGVAGWCFYGTREYTTVSVLI